MLKRLKRVLRDKKNNTVSENDAERKRLFKLRMNEKKRRIARAHSEHLMRRVPAKAYVGAEGGTPAINKMVNADRWTRYLDTNQRRIMLSKKGVYFVINYDNNNKPHRVYNPVAAYLNNPVTGNIINIRNNTPLPMRLKSVEMKGNRVYDQKRDLKKFSHPVVYDQKKRWGGIRSAPNRTKVFKMLKNYTNMAKYANEYVTGNEPYSIGNFPKNSKWYIPLTLNNKKKFKK